MSAEPQIIFTGASRRGWHRLQQALECLQKYAYTYGTNTHDGIVDREEDKKRPALLKGELMHLALAQHYARIYAEQQGGSVSEFEDPKDAVVFMATHALKVPEYIDLICSVFDAYQAHYAHDHHRMKIVGVERLFETTVRGKYLFTGRLDLIWRDDQDQVWACDHKTTSRLTASHKQYYAASGQLIGYQYLARQEYPDLAGMKLNLIQVSERPKFERITLPRAPNFEKQFEQTVVDAEEAITRANDSGRGIHAWPKAMNELTCFHRYGACKFMETCRWGAQSGVAGNWSLAGDWRKKIE